MRAFGGVVVKEHQCVDADVELAGGDITLTRYEGSAV